MSFSHYTVAKGGTFFGFRVLRTTPVCARGYPLFVPMKNSGCLRDYFAKHSEEQLSSGIGDGKPGSFLFLVVMPGAPSSVLAPSSKARSP